MPFGVLKINLCEEVRCLVVSRAGKDTLGQLCSSS